ncbi:MAG: alanine dehydrogenase [Ilumatobacteraceae bacterium]
MANVTQIQHTALTSVGVPAEVKPSERRVAITPDGAAELVHRGCRVLVQSGAGAGAGFPDDEYVMAGATVVPTAAEAWAAQLVVKVKEPYPTEFGHLRSDLTLFTYLHLAAYPQVASALVDAGSTAFAYETVDDRSGGLPLLAPMSEIAGQLATQMGAHHLSAHLGGSGVLLGGVPGVRPGRVAVIGAGHVGWAAARIALGLGAEVTVIDRDLERLRWVDQHRSDRLVTVASSRSAVARAVAESDLVVGAVLVAGDRAPVVVDRSMVAAMRPGSVIVDVAVDQGGCVETTVETTHDDPVRVVEGVVHYAVGNMPGAVPRTAAMALTNATLPYIVRLATDGVDAAASESPGLGNGLNVRAGRIVNPTVAAALGG